MKVRTTHVLFMILIVLCAFPLAAAPQEGPIDTVRIDTNLVLLRVTVNDQQGRAAMKLKQDAFKVFEDNTEQKIGFFSTEESPVSWGLVLDRSGSMEEMIGDVYDAALHVIDDGTSRDETFIVTFNSLTDLVIDFTSDQHRLENAVIGLKADGQTALYDAVKYGLDHLKQSKNRKKVLVVVTDGEDNASHVKLRELIERAEEEEAVIYTVGMFGSMAPPSGLLAKLMGQHDSRSELKKLAEVTGGSSHFPENVDQCKAVMREIAREVSQQYSIGYYPANKDRDGKWRKIKVLAGESGNATRLVARTRSGYYARAN